jgi:hypothetical protein
VLVVKFDDESEREFWIPEKSLDLLQEALLKLYNDPGVHPRTGKPTNKRIVSIIGRSLYPSECWWGLTDEEEKAGKTGPIILDLSAASKQIWPEPKSSNDSY